MLSNEYSLNLRVYWYHNITQVLLFKAYFTISSTFISFQNVQLKNY
jgi:hypothetical protein